MTAQNRRSFLKKVSGELLEDKPASAKVQGYVDPSNKVLPLGLRKTTTGLSPYTGTFGNDQLLHLLRRTMFGVQKSDLTFFQNKTVGQVVDALLTIDTTTPAPPINYYNTAAYTDPSVALGQTWITAPYTDGTANFKRIYAWKAWWEGLMINQDRTIREKMCLFWHNHFSTQTSVVSDARYVYYHHALLRQNCMGNFKSIVKQVTTDPAMLRYLNGSSNTKTAPDENYGRELQELFTVGKDLANHFTEDDVKAAARVLTGFRENSQYSSTVFDPNIASSFDPTKHDTSNKTFSAFYNNTVITGKSGASGATELDDLLTMIFNVDEVAKFICRKIYRFFVYYVIDATVETNVIVPLANIFRSSNYDIKAVMSALLKSEHFFDPLNIGCQIKSPVDFVVGMMRQFNVALPTPASTNYVALYNHWLFLEQVGTIMSQELGDPPNVAGWPAYYQTPQFHELWLNSDTLPKRNSIADGLIYAGYNNSGFKTIIDCVAFTATLKNPEDPNLLIAEAYQLLCAVPVSDTTKTTIKVSALLSGQTSDHYWTDAWNTYLANTSNATNKAVVSSRLQALYRFMLDAAEYQLS